jgi:hypothetical protein
VDIVIGGIEEATPDWLTMILSQRGFLLKGKVQSLKVTRTHTKQAHSIGYFLAVEYTYRISPGTNDLAYTIILRYPHRTLANERDWVKCYHEGLLRNGVTGYNWEQCWHDYRRSTAEQILVTLNWAGWASNGRYIQRALTGFRDLACNEFLHSAL